MLRRFSNRREATPESITAKSLGRAKPIHTMNTAPVSARLAAPFFPDPLGKSHKGSKTRAMGKAQKPAQPRAGGELL